MPNANYKRGVRFEREVMAEYEYLGYQVMRTAGSHGPYDVIAVSERSVSLIQCKVVDSPKKVWTAVSKWKPKLNTVSNVHQLLKVKVLNGDTFTFYAGVKYEKANVDSAVSGDYSADTVTILNKGRS